MQRRTVYNRALKALRTAHKACFEHEARDGIGMSHGPFSGVNEVLGTVLRLEQLAWHGIDLALKQNGVWE